MSIGGSVTQSLSSLILGRPNGALFGVDANTSVFATQAGELGGWNPSTMSLSDSGVIQNLTQGFSALSLVSSNLTAEELPVQLESAIDILTFDQGGRKELQVLANLERQLMSLSASLPVGSETKTQLEANLQTINAYQKGLKINEYASKRATSLVLTELQKERQVADFLRSNETHPMIEQIANIELQRRSSVAQSLDILAKTTEVGLQAAFLDPADPAQDNVEYTYSQLSDLYDQAELQRFQSESDLMGLIGSNSGQSAQPNMPMLGRVYRMAAHIALIDQLDDVVNKRLAVESQLGAKSIPDSLSNEESMLNDWMNNDNTIDSALDRAPERLQSVQLGLTDAKRRSGYFTLGKLKGFVDSLNQSLANAMPYSAEYRQAQSELQQVQAMMTQTTQTISSTFLQEQTQLGQFGSWRG